MSWDLFCRVVDNWGDIGVCWRLAGELAARGVAVRLWIDDARALGWLAPRGHDGVAVADWQAAATAEPAEVVIETFGCGLPEPYLRRMAARAAPPKWINVEHLSAEAYVERSHCLPSPQSAGLTRWFFYPGFSARTGGLLREVDLPQRRQRFRRRHWLQARGIEPAAGERLVSLFCYDNPALPLLLDALAERPTLLLATHGLAAQQVAALLGPELAHRQLRALLLPALSQLDYDRLLWSCELNFVRGEDSFMRAQWAGAPLVWQIYRQSDDAHAVKLQAWLDRYLAGAAPSLAEPVRRLHAAWNDLGPPASEFPAPVAWQAHARRWRQELLALPDMVGELLAFAAI
jgi:uncharacterized repeat protein (TIGR03837 family)